MVEAGKQLKEQLVEAEAAAAAAEQALQREGQRLPNLTHPDVSQPPLRHVLFTFLLLHALLSAAAAAGHEAGAAAPAAACQRLAKCASKVRTVSLVP